MARTVVLIFLLDSIPEFPLILNQTLQETLWKIDSNYTLQQCNTIIATSILQRANDTIYENTPNWKLMQTKEVPIEEFRRLLPDSAYNADAVFDNSIADSFENPLENIQDYFDNEINSFGIQQKLKQKDSSSVAKSKGVGLESPPFLVAIFETVSNVTANTCAGTLLSPHWVVTAASCVGVLSEFYGNDPNSTENSRYTIVSGSTNPLIDGSIHNVTEILLHPPLNTMDHARNSSNANTLNIKLVMMKVNPGLAVEKMKILGEKEISDAVAYGWILAVNESKKEVILPLSIAIKRTNQTHCHTKEGGLASSALCFSAEGGVGRNSNKLGVGGPALVHNRMLGVVSDDRVPLLVVPLAAHPWIQQLINADSM